MEIKGKVIKLNNENGIVYAEDGKNYYFNKLDIINDETIMENDIIVFKPIFYKIKREIFYKATLISKFE